MIPSRLVAPLGAYVLLEIAVFALLFALVGAPLWLGALCGLVMGLLIIAVILARSDSVQLQGVDHKPFDASTHPRVASVLDALTVTNGVAMPTTVIVTTDHVNAGVFGYREPTLVVTSGLLDMVDRVELEGLMAHLVAVFRDRDVAAETAASSIARFLPGHGLKSWIMARVSQEAATVRADMAGARMTRYPPALISALEKIRGCDTSVAGVREESAHLWLAPPVAGRHEPHPTLEERVAVLREL